MKALSFSDYKKLKDLSYNQLNIWLKTFYQSAYEEGQNESVSSYQDASVISSDELYSLMISAGISSSKAEEVIGRICDG